MTIGVYSLQKVLFQGEAREVNLRTKMGEITVLDHHRPLISILERGTMKIIDREENEHYIPVRSGFIEVNADNQAKILVEEDPAPAK